MMDKELWVLSGRSPVLWTIPFYVAYDSNGLAVMESAMSLTLRQREAVAERLSLIGERKDGFWHVKRTDLEQAGTITAGGDPELYFSWSLPRPQDEKPDPDKDQRSEFLDALFMAGVGKSRGELEYYWNQFCRHMLDWLLNKQKPVDLYFLKLHPTPYRANWKQILCGRYPKLWRTVGQKSGAMRDLILDQSGFREHLLCLDLLAWNMRDGICYRHVEVEHCKGWWSNVRNTERARMINAGVFGYAKNVTDCLKRNLAASLRIYGAYLAQIARPSVAHVEGDAYGEYRFVPNVPRGHTRPYPPRTVLQDGVFSSKIPDFVPARQPADEDGEKSVLLKMPVVQRPDEDLRDGGGDVPAPEGTATG